MTVSAQEGEDRAQTNWDELKHDAAGAARETAEEARDAGYAFVHGARERAADYLERRKDSAVQSIDDVAQTLREAGETFDDRPNIRLFVDSAADGLESFAEEVRDRSFVEVYSDMERFARRRPALFAGAAGVAGFLIARFMKSSAEDTDARQAYGEDMRAKRHERRYGGGGYAPGTRDAGFARGPAMNTGSEHKASDHTASSMSKSSEQAKSPGDKASTEGVRTPGATSGAQDSGLVSGTRTPDRSGGAAGSSNPTSAQSAANLAARPQGER